MIFVNIRPKHIRADKLPQELHATYELFQNGDNWIAALPEEAEKLAVPNSYVLTKSRAVLKLSMIQEFWNVSRSKTRKVRATKPPSPASIRPLTKRLAQLVGLMLLLVVGLRLVEISTVIVLLATGFVLYLLVLAHLFWKGCVAYVDHRRKITAFWDRAGNGDEVAIKL